MNMRRSPSTRRNQARHKHGRAFTLAEVLATLVLISIVLPVVMRGVSLALSASSHARYTAQAASLGEAKLTELTISGQWSMTAVAGDFGPEWPQYRWSCQTFARDFGTNEVVLQVTWLEKGAERSLSLSTMAYDNGTLSGVLP